MRTNTKTYTVLSRLSTFEDRFEYLKIGGYVGESTFGSERYLNQSFYRSKEWRAIRNEIIVRDSFNGYPCDLGDQDHPIFGRVVIHHINPITIEDIELGSDFLLNPEFLICTTELTHKALHFGDFELLPKDFVERRPFDTSPWR